jgi:hypothetical protein
MVNEQAEWTAVKRVQQQFHCLIFQWEKMWAVGKGNERAVHWVACSVTY